MTRQLLVIWCSTTGAAGQMAAAAHAAAMAEGPALLRHADAATPADVLAAAGYLFVTPELLGSMAGAMKSCFERSYYPALGRIEGRPYGLIVAAGSDGTGAARQVARIVTGWRLRAVAPPLILVGGATTPAAILAAKTVPAPALARCAELGATLAAGLAMGVF